MLSPLCRLPWALPKQPYGRPVKADLSGVPCAVAPDALAHVKTLLSTDVLATKLCVVTTLPSTDVLTTMLCVVTALLSSGVSANMLS